MNIIKKILGICWILTGPCVIVFMIREAVEKTAMAAEGLTRTNTALQWGIILLVFIPVSLGLMLFGYYAMRGEYSQLPRSSAELEK